MYHSLFSNLLKFIAIWMLEMYYRQALRIRNHVLKSKHLLFDRQQATTCQQHSFMSGIYIFSRGKSFARTISQFCPALSMNKCYLINIFILLKTLT